MSNFAIPNRPAGTDTRHVADIEGDFDYVTGLLDNITGGKRLLWSGLVDFPGGVSAANWLMSSLGNLYTPGVSIAAAIDYLYLDSAQWPTLTGKTPQLFLDLCVGQGAAQNTNFTLSLYSVSFTAGTGSQIQIALGSQVAGSGVTVTANTGGAVVRADGSASPFGFPAAGAYAPILTNSANTAVSTLSMITANLWMKYT